MRDIVEGNMPTCFCFDIFTVPKKRKLTALLRHSNAILMRLGRIRRLSSSRFIQVFRMASRLHNATKATCPQGSFRLENTTTNKGQGNTTEKPACLLGYLVSKIWAHLKLQMVGRPIDI